MIKNKPVIVLGSSLVSSSLPKLIQEITKDELEKEPELIITKNIKLMDDMIFDSASNEKRKLKLEKRKQRNLKFLPKVN